MTQINESVIVSVDFSDKDEGVMIVGKQVNDQTHVINAFIGKEAWNLYRKLFFVSKEKPNEFKMD